MHIGNLRTALYAYLFARRNKGKFVLRIEDTDLERYVDGAVDIIYRTLNESGMRYDEGPGKGGVNPPYIQSERKDIYRKYAERLVKTGAAYYCFCSKERLEEMRSAQGDATKYDKHCLGVPSAEVKRRIAAGESCVIRQNIPASGLITYTDLVFGEISIDCKDLEDNILIKSDGMPTYNFANVVDDHLMRITHVIRGIEYLSSTPKYNLIYKALGWREPQYMHLPPIMKDAQHKLSKRYGDASYEDFREKGYLKEAVINYIALLGWSPKDNREKFSLAELEEIFSAEGLNRSPAIFDEAKMRWLNAQYVRELTPEKYLEHAERWLDGAGCKGKYDYKLATKLLQGRTEVFSQIPELIDFLNRFDGYDLGLFDNQKQKTDVRAAKALLPGIIRAVEGAPDFTSPALYERLQTLAADGGVKSGAVMWIARIALTGAQTTPGGATEMAELLGKDESLRRLNASLKRLEL
jgi:glutamyl-tRNA synthetase